MPSARFIIAISLVLAALPAEAHHSVLHYDGKTQLTISGTVTQARFGFPHSVYRIDVTADDGTVQEWILSTEDPKDAERLGFADEIRAIRAGDAITVTGWPHRFNDLEIRGHKLHYPDGRVVMMRRGNYIWPKDILRLDRLVMNPENIDGLLDDVDPSLSDGEQVVRWIAEGDHIARAAYEISRERPRLIGLDSGSGPEFPGVDDLLICHTEREGFTLTIRPGDLDGELRTSLRDGSAYVSEYNRVLSRWWEQERSSCE